VAQALFERSRVQPALPPLRDTTRNLVEIVLLDVWPRNAAVVDFGLRTQEHYEALYHPLRHGEITPEQVDAAPGNGQRLTELDNDAPHNPHQGIAFRNDWDDLRPEPVHDGKVIEQLPSPGDIAGGADGPGPSSPERGQGRGW
jgi:hypothetical protein